MNPFGGVPLFFALTADFSDRERNRTALKTAMYVFGILVVFMFFGRFVLNFFGISLPVLQIAGGLIVAHTAWGMVTASTRITPAESDEAAEKERYFADSDGDAHALRARARSAWSWAWRRTPTV